MGAGAEHCLAITQVDFGHYLHIHSSVVYLLPATSSDGEELQLLMAPITAVIIIYIELNLCFSSIFNAHDLEINFPLTFFFITKPNHSDAHSKAANNGGI